MNDSIKRISLDVHRTSSGETVNAKRGDTARTIIISLVDGGMPYIIGEDCYAVFTGKKPDGNAVFNDCTIKDNTIIYAFTEQTVAVEGRVNCEIKLYGADGKLITSPKFTICVSGTVYNEGDEIESSDEFNALTFLVANTQKAIKEAQEAIKKAQEMEASVERIDNTNSQTATVLHDLAEGPYVLNGFFPYNGNSDEGILFSDDLVIVEKYPVEDGTNVQFLKGCYLHSVSITSEDVLDYTKFPLVNFENTENRVTIIDETSDDEHYPTAKAVYDALLSYSGSSSSGQETPDYSMYFDIDYDGLVSLKEGYRGLGNASFPYSISDNGVGYDGSKISELPEKLVVPDVIDGTAVTGFQPGMLYYNYRVRELTIPDAVTELPERLCSEAFNLEEIHNTEQITKIGGGALSYTQVQKALFPNLETLAVGAFAAASFLYVVDIGNKITEIPTVCFTQCTQLSVVKGGSNVTKIGVQGFRYTRNLKNLPFLSLLKVTSIGTQAFYGSRIQFDWGLLTGECTIGDLAAPTKDNTVDYWSGVEPTSCENKIVSTLSQTDPEWTGNQIGNSEHTYGNGCAFFAVLHIHSALSGRVYTNPDEFLTELLEINPLYAYEGSQTVGGQQGKLPFEFINVAPMFEDLGYTATAYTGNITEDTYRELCNALARGAYVYTAVSAANANSGHAVALYGINANKEMLVIDSMTLHHKYRAVGVDDVFTYRMAHPNLCGPSSSFVIVEMEE